MPKAEQISKKAAAAEAKELEEARAAATREAAEWDDGAKKPSAKKLAEETKKADKAQRKAENDEALEAELAEASKPGKSSGINQKSKYASLSAKLTQGEIADNLAAEAKKKEKEAKEASKDVVNEYMGKLVENTNSLDAINASSLEDAIAALDASNDTSVDKVKMRAAFEAFQEAELPRCKEEKPGLKLSQYKEMVWKSWQKSPQNPLKQRG